MYTFTVFTPVHNRRHTIHRVWESLINQTFNDFEWIVIDNESEDNILPLLYEYKEKAKFNVTVIFHKNRGLHFSWNKAVRKARGELFVTMDSDDRFVPETLEKFNYWWNYIIERYKISDFSGINVLCMNPEDNKIIGDAYPENPWISNSLEMSYKHKLKGEKWGCVRTELLKQRLFPERKTENVYFPETYIWYYLAKNIRSYV